MAVGFTPPLSCPCASYTLLPSFSPPGTRPLTDKSRGSVNTSLKTTGWSLAVVSNCFTDFSIPDTAPEGQTFPQNKCAGNDTSNPVRNVNIVTDELQDLYVPIESIVEVRQLKPLSGAKGKKHDFLHWR